MSTKPVAKKKEGSNEVTDFEQQFILRLPPGPAAALREDLRSGNQSLKDRLLIDIGPDMRTGSVHYAGQAFPAKLVDLPSMIDSLKTVDNKTFYKTADISQMLLCTTGDEVVNEEGEPAKRKDKEKKHQYSHGITPPLKNVRKKRFRKVLKKKYMDQPEIEREVKRLFRYDAEAIDVNWEVVYDEEKPSSDSAKYLPVSVVEASGTVTKSQHNLFDTHMSSVDFDKSALFGELSSSGSESDLDESNPVDSGEEPNQTTHNVSGRSVPTPADSSLLSLTNDDPDDSMGRCWWLLLIFSDAKNFTRDQKINRRNNRWLCSNLADVPMMIASKFLVVVMVLGVISNKGRASHAPCFFPKALQISAKDYLAVLKDVVKTWMDKITEGDHYILQQVDAPSHTNNIMQKWCKNNLREF